MDLKMKEKSCHDGVLLSPNHVKLLLFILLVLANSLILGRSIAIKE